MRGRRSRGVARDCEDRGGYDWRRRVIGLPMRARLHRSQDFVEKSRWQMRRLPYAWIVDDALSMFYRLVPLSHHEAPQQPTYVGERAWVQRLKERSAPKGARMFREAFVAVQRHPFITRAAVAGFLRDDGTAVCKRMDWKSDELSLYKVAGCVHRGQRLLGDLLGGPQRRLEDGAKARRGGSPEHRVGFGLHCSDLGENWCHRDFWI